MNIRRIASAAAAVAAALALAGPAMADDDDDDGGGGGGPCPKGYIPVFDVFNITGADANDNDIVCGKTTPTGDIFVDDRP
jgi:hypothetical protein